MPPTAVSPAPDAPRASAPSTALADASFPASGRARLLRTWPILAPVLWLALFLRAYRLNGQSLWSDEGISAVMAGRSVADILLNAAGDVHPPLYYLLLRGWAHVAGTTETALRSLSVFFGVLTVAATYALARRLFGRSAAFAAAAIAALAPYLVHYSQEARMYAPLAAWAVLTLYCAVRYATSTRPAWAPLGGYALAAAALCLTQYFGAVYLIAPGLALVLLRPPFGNHRRWWRGWLGANAAVLALVLPWGLYVLPHLPALATGGDALGRRDFLAMAAQTLTFGRAAPIIPAEAYVLAIVVAIAAALGLLLWAVAPALAAPGRRLRVALILALAMALPVAALYLLTLRRPFYFPEYMKLLLPLVPLMAVAVAAGIAGLGQTVGQLVRSDRADREAMVGLPAVPPSARSRDGRPRSARAARALPAIITLLAVVAVAGIMAPALHAYYRDPRLARDDYRGLVAYLGRNVREGDAVILDAPEQTEIFNYYAAGRWDQYPLPRQRPIDDAATRSELMDIASRYHRVWLVLWAWQEADPRRVVETTLNARGFRTADRWFGNVQLALYTLPRPGEHGVTVAVGADFGDGAVLDRVEFPSAVADGLTVQPGAALPVTLVWRAGAEPAKRYSAFVHLAGDDRVPWAQHDSEPGGGTLLTTTWKAGDVIADRHGLSVPLGTPPGRYHLLAGLYDTQTGVRQVPQGQAAPSDTAVIGAVTVLRSDPPPVAALPIRNRLTAPLGPLQVVGADVEPVGANGAGGELRSQAWADVVLHWRAATRPGVAYRVALSLRQGDREVARQESAPAAQFPTAAWETGEIVRDQRRMFLGVPSGTYRLLAELLTEHGAVVATARLPDVVVQP